MPVEHWDQIWIRDTVQVLIQGCQRLCSDGPFKAFFKSETKRTQFFTITWYGPYTGIIPSCLVSEKLQISSKS